MEWYYSFLYGLLGALLVYLANFRETRLQKLLEGKGLTTLQFIICDIGIFLTCGGLASALLAQPESVKDAGFAGAGWQGLLAGIAIGPERKMALTKQEKDEIIGEVFEAWEEYIARKRQSSETEE